MCCLLIQRFVIITALGRLYAARAALLTWALSNCPKCSLPQFLHHVKTPLSNANAAGVSIIDKYLGLPGIGVERGRYATNIIPITQSKQGKNANSRVFSIDDYIRSEL